MAALEEVVINRARNVAQAAWTHQSFRISSWSCMGPCHRQSATISSSKSEENSASSDHLRPSTSETESVERTEVVTSEGGQGWTSEHSQDINNDDDDDDEGSSDGEDLMGHGRIEDSMTEVELWQRLEHELNQPRSEEVAVDEEEEEDMTKEVREEEEEIAAASEVADSVSIEPTTEMRRFFPPGKIMHIVSIPREETANEEEESKDGGRSPSPKIPRVGIFLTPRSLYGKLRLSRTMINDHYMPMYKRNIELVISELEKEDLLEECHL